jgi:hypothetical protein
MLLVTTNNLPPPVHEDLAQLDALAADAHKQQEPQTNLTISYSHAACYD